MNEVSPIKKFETNKEEIKFDTKESFEINTNDKNFLLKIALNEKLMLFDIEQMDLFPKQEFNIYLSLEELGKINKYFLQFDYLKEVFESLKILIKKKNLFIIKEEKRMKIKIINPANDKEFFITVPLKEKDLKSNNNINLICYSEPKGNEKILNNNNNTISYNGTPKKRKLSDYTFLKRNLLNSKKKIMFSEELEMEEMIKSNSLYLENLSYNKKNFQFFEMKKEEKELFKLFLFLKKSEEFKIYKINDVINYNQIKFIIQELSLYFQIKLIEKNKEIIFEHQSRIINFIDEKQKVIYTKFIYSSSNLTEVMKEIKFESFYIKPEEFVKKEKLKESKSSNVSNDFSEKSSTISYKDPLVIFLNESITNIFKYNIFPILSEKNYKELEEKDIYDLKDNILLKDISNTSIHYFNKEKDRKFIWFDEYIKVGFSLRYFAEFCNTQIMYLYGPKGCSKSTFLLFNRHLLKSFHINNLYFNVDYLKTKNYLETKRIISYELLYLFENIDEMKSIEEKKIFHNIKVMNKDILNYIYLFLKNLLNSIDFQNRKNQIVIIIDNIYNCDMIIVY